MKLWSALLLGGLFFLTALSDREAAAQISQDSAHFETSSGLHFFAGGTVTVVEDDADDIYAAGGSISVVSTTAEDLILAGGSIAIKNVTVEGVVVAGGEINVDGTLSQDLVATGGSIEVASATSIGGDAIVSGGTLSINGTIGGSLAVAGAEIEIDARIGGDAEVRGGSVTFAPGTVITGDLTYWSEDSVDIPSGMTVGGSVTELEGDQDFDLEDSTGFSFWGWALVGVAIWLGAVVALLVFGAVILAVFPGLLGRSTEALSVDLGMSLGVGFAALVSVPVGLVMLMATVIGIPLALFGLALYAVLVGLALVAICQFAGLKTVTALKGPSSTATLSRRIGWTAIGFVLFLVVGSLPFVGNLLQFLALAAGFGALAMTMWQERASA